MIDLVRLTTWTHLGRFALLALMLALPFASADAHGVLRSSAPADRATLGAPPTELRLTFNETPELAVTSIELMGPDGAARALGALTTHPDSANVIITPIVDRLRPGRYTVRWRIVARDGHPVRGTFSFMVEPSADSIVAADPIDTAHHRGAQGLVPAPGQDTVPAEHHPAGEQDALDVQSLPHAIARWLMFAGILGVVGAAAFNGIVLGALRRQGREPEVQARARARAAAVGLSLAFVLILVAFGRLYLQSAAVHGIRAAMEIPLVVTMIASTLWGWGWVLQIAASLLAIAGFVLARRRGTDGAWRVATVGALMLAVTPALSGHAAGAGGLAPLAIGLDTLHVLAASGWLGTLLVLLVAGLPSVTAISGERRADTVVAMVTAFSSAALLFAALAAATGTFSAWLHLGTITQLWRSDYGRILLLKLAVLSIVAATGAYNWRRVTPVLHAANGADRLRRSATVEVIVAVLVLAITAVLVATPPPPESTG